MTQRPSPPELLESWTAVDRELERLLAPSDPVFEEAVRASAEAGLPPIQVSPLQGRLLGTIARAVAARRILEIGTLGGYSAICLGRALPPEGRLVTLEIESRHAEVARRNVARAGLSDRVTIRLGPALDSLAELEREGGGPFDLVFVDADKASYPDYLDWAVRLGRPGTLILFDNVVRRGEILDPASVDPAVRGVRRTLEKIGADAHLQATAIQTVGAKGHDGFAAVVIASR